MIRVGVLQEAVGSHAEEERKREEGRTERNRKRKSHRYKEKRKERKKEGCTQRKRNSIITASTDKLCIKV